MIYLEIYIDRATLLKSFSTIMGEFEKSFVLFIILGKGGRRNSCHMGRMKRIVVCLFLRIKIFDGDII